MIELEIQVLSERREGLLVELGRVVVANGFSLLRQRLSQDNRGAWLTMIVRGPSDQRFALEEILGTHSRVVTFEGSMVGETIAGAEPIRSPLTAPASAPITAPTTVTRAVSAPALSASSRPSHASYVPAPVATVDVRQVEQILPKLAQDYPNVYPWLVSLENAVTDDTRGPSLALAGRRTGAWVYKRDYSLGAQLGLTEAIKRIAAPALRGLVEIEQLGMHVHILNSPLCAPGAHSGCRFFSGYLEGLLGAAVSPKAVFVRNIACRSTGAANCSMEISR